MANILVVDDIEENRGLLNKILSKEGHNIILAEDGKIALHKLKETPIDLIMLDYMMPNLNGFETLCAIKEDSTLRHIPVLMISAANEIEKIVECIGKGAEDYLPKPFNINILKARVKAMIEKNHLRKQEIYYQEELRKKQSEIGDKQKMASLGQLSAGIAHELKNPMNFVLNFAQIIRDTLTDNTEKLCLNTLKSNAQKIVEHTERMDEIIKHMLSMSRNSQQDWQFLDINVLLEQAIFFAHNAFKSKSGYAPIIINKNFQTVEPFLVSSYDLSRCFINLIDNALFTMAKKLKLSKGPFVPCLTLSTYISNKELHITIKDNGEGLSDEVINNLFKAFFTTKEDGAGLGLFLSYEVVIDKHLGNMEVSTKEQEWTEFKIILPKLNFDQIVTKN